VAGWCERLLVGGRFFAPLDNQFLCKLFKLDLHVVVQGTLLFVRSPLQFLVYPIRDTTHSYVWHEISIHTKCSHCQINMLTV
jgi:hypothetical protein